MPLTRREAYEALESLNPAPIFLESYSTRPLPENLDIYFGPPEEFFIAPETQAAYTQDRLVPVLDDGNFDVVTFLDPAEGELIQKFVEGGDTGATFNHWQQYLAALMLRIGESVDDDRIRRIAGLVDFRHAHRLFEYFDQVQGLPPDEWQAARKQFLLSIPDGGTRG